jgi:Domain of unknown function (DUF4382)
VVAGRKLHIIALIDGATLVSQARLPVEEGELMKHSYAKCCTLQWATLTALVVLAASALVGCGGGSTPATTPPTANTTAVLVNMGDSPSDRVMAMSMTISAMGFTNSSGTSVAALSSPMTLEMLHLMGTMQPAAMPKLPQGTYTQMSVTVSSAIVSYVDPTTHNVIQKTVSGPMTATMTLNPALTVGSSAMVMNLDMDVAHSVSIDGSGNVTMTPTFRPFANTAMANATDPEHGGMMHMIGSVSSTAGNSFTMSTLSGMQFSMATSTGTQFQNMGGMGSMGNGLILMVNGIMQPDGSINAQYVQNMMTSGGLMAMGTVAAVTSSPATQLSLVPMDGIGSGMMSSVLANGMTVDVGSGTTYSIDKDGVDMTGLPFTPEFDATRIYAGQLVSSASSSGMAGGGGMMGGGMGGMTNAGTQTASSVRLEPQGLNGSVNNYTAGAGTATFALTVASDSVFASLTGATSITVFQQAGTQLRDITSVTNGASVHVRGLLFLDSGTYKLVATRIVAAQ